MTNIVIIPARSGSTRIPNKNIRIFHGIPMLEMTIRETRRAKSVDCIIVSTDSLDYLKIAQATGVVVPHLRSPELAGDSVSTIEVILDCIVRNEIDEMDNVCCIYPTNPLLDGRIIDLGLRMLERATSPCYVTPVVSYGFPPQRSLRLHQEDFLTIAEPLNLYARSQDLEPTYHETSQFWWAKASTWLSRIPMQELIAPIKTKEWMQQDIDSEDDIILADAKYSFKLNNQELWEDEIKNLLEKYQ